MNSRQRIEATLAHTEPDRVPLDLGGSSVTGMHVTVVYRLRQALGLDAPGTPVKVIRPYLMLGEIAPDLIETLDIDAVRLAGSRTMFGYPAADWKPWTTFDGTPVLVPGRFNTIPEPETGDLFQYPEGDTSLPPSGRMPAGGWYFDAIIRQDPIDEARLDPADNLEEFGPMSEADLAAMAAAAKRLYATGRAILAQVPGTAFGDIAAVPATWLRHPRGIRDVAEWYMSTITRRDYIYQVFERQCEIALGNLARVHAAIGERITAVYLTGTDFGMQTGPFISPRAYRDLYQPFHRRLNDWIHTHTGWKTFIHSCGSVVELIDDFIAAGFDILNPVQTAAAGMDPAVLKRRFGQRITFWGGGADTQGVLSFGTPADVRRQVRERIAALGPGGGFVFNPVHNVQPNTPVENLLAMLDALREYGVYPL